MKAWQATTKTSDYGSTVVFAETAGQAKAIAIGTDACLDADFTEIRVSRLPKADILYCGQNEAPWWDEKTRNLLVKEYDWRCIEIYHDECENCSAKKWCDEYESYIEEQEEFQEMECEKLCSKNH